MILINILLFNMKLIRKDIIVHAIIVSILLSIVNGQYQFEYDTDETSCMRCYNSY